MISVVVRNSTKMVLSGCLESSMHLKHISETFSGSFFPLFGSSEPGAMNQLLSFVHAQVTSSSAWGIQVLIFSMKHAVIAAWDSYSVLVINMDSCWIPVCIMSFTQRYRVTALVRSALWHLARFSWLRFVARLLALVQYRLVSSGLL
jgi:hypothetical protein